MNAEMTSTQAVTDVPGWKLERYLLGELPGGELEAIRALELSDGGLRSRINALRDDNARLLEMYPPKRMGRLIDAECIRRANLGANPAAKHVGNTANTRTRPLFGGIISKYRNALNSRNIPRWAAPAFACAAAVLIILPAGLFDDGHQDVAISANTASGNRVKGAVFTDPALEVWRKEGGEARKLEPSDAVREGDIVQLRYIVPESCYGALISIDGRGTLTVHLSGSNGKAAQLTPGRPIALKTSYQLDDAPSFETFYLITAPANFDVEGMARSLKKVNHPVNNIEDDLSLPQENKVTAFMLRKFDSGGI